MKTEIQIKPVAFDFNGQAVRSIHRHGQPWFVADDVCQILGIKNNRDTLAKVLSETEKGVDSIYTLGGQQRVGIVSESGLYKLMFKSRKPEAEAFCDWVTGEVLPTLRKTGFYALGVARQSGAVAVECNRALAKRRLLRELDELEREPLPGMDYSTLDDFITARSLSLAGRDRAEFSRNVARCAKATGRDFVVIYARTRPDRHYPLPVLLSVAASLPPSPQLQLPS